MTAEPTALPTWNGAQSTSPIDYRQIPSTFTAVATYTRTATRTSTIGYTTTAVYHGQLSRISIGHTEFTVNFIGIPIVAPIVTLEPTIELECELGSELESEPAILHVEQVHIGGIIIETEIPYVPDVEVVDESSYEEIADPESNEPKGFPIRNILTVAFFIAGIIIAYFVGKKGIAIFSPVKKLSCLVLCVCLILGTHQTVYATQAIHFNPNHNRHGTYSIANLNPASSEAIHFHPQVNNTHIGSHQAMNPMQNVPNTYNYGDFLGYLTVERFGRRIRVIGGATMSAMDHGAAHFSFTGLNHGNTGLIGHNRGRTNGFFSFVEELREADILTLDAGGIVRSYIVTDIFIIDETDFSPLMQCGSTRLTLVTCVKYQRNQRLVASAVMLEI
jgi:LPXTG-site transpeptidase (sortase) family protein